MAIMAGQTIYRVRMMGAEVRQLRALARRRRVSISALVRAAIMDTPTPKRRALADLRLQHGACGGAHVSDPA